MYTNHKLLLMILVLWSFELSGQVVFKGKVIDQNTSEPLAGVVISANNNEFAATNLNGEYSFNRSSDTTEVVFSYIGYEKKRLRNLSTKAVIKMTPSSTVLNQLVVSTNRFALDRSAAPVAISTISTVLLEETKATRLDEVLNKVEGVYMVDLGNEQHTMAIRQPINYKGLFLYLEDGVPIRPTGVFNHNALLEMNMAGLRRIEVIRGPASSLYGSEAIGGAINFITLRPAAIPTGRLSVQGNTNGYRRVDFSGSNSFSKLGLGVYGYYANRTDGIRAHTDFDKLALTLKTNYIINDQNTLAFDVTRINYEADMTGNLDSAFFFSKDFTSQHTFTNRAVDALRTKIRYNHFWQNESKTMIAVFARENSIRQNPAYRVKDDYSPWGNPTGNKNLAHGEVNEDKVNSYGLVGQHTQQFTWLSGAQLSLGMNLDMSPNQFQAHYIAIHKNDEQVYADFAKTDSLLTNYEAQLRNIGTYVNWRMKLTDRLQISAALRYDRLNFDFKNHLDESAFSGAPDNADHFSAITPKVGLTYNFQPSNGLFINYSQGFLPPQISELYRGVKVPVLKPSVYHNYEIGGYFQLGKHLSFDMSMYQMNGENEIISVLLDNGSRENRNAGKTQHRGVEYGIKWLMGENVHFRLSGTNASHVFQDYKEDGADYSDNEMGQAPAWIANAELSYKPSFFKNFRASLEWQHVDQYYMDNGNTGTYPGYDIFNLRWGYELKNVEVWMNIMNATDQLYATVVRRSQWGDSYSAGEPRTWNIGMAYNFNNKQKQDR